MSDIALKAQEFSDKVVTKMVSMGYHVETTNKSGYYREKIFVDGYIWSEEYFNENMARLLIGGWYTKAALVMLLQIILEYKDSKTLDGPI